ncbi:cAMP-specific 3',5'-cyclic phosphodiesterase-like [Scaptodrosophila lebanonensis]|uniref:cAMP-specific 3',5'-cyclic phosphodiesterase-like n=1 Tax=Drosophila lebanonensis TaxID=7225 RepID=A0A6J2TY51_DROLE|nr:cAMP-specific 3',5'-cyclic phosphodiesterase-like [Scaptodrosophila lebanonensis]
MMRLAKLSYGLTFKNGAQKCAEQPPSGKCQPALMGKVVFGSGTSRSSIGSIGNGLAQNNSNGHGSAVEPLTGGVAQHISTTQEKRLDGSNKSSKSSRCSRSSNSKLRKSKPKTKCFGGTVFRCCLPCRGGGSAAPATSPSQSPVQTTDDLKQLSENKQQQQQGGDLEQQSPQETLGDLESGLVTGEKKHSLADTIGTSVTTPISLKTLINDVDEDLEQPLSAADIAAASLSSGIVARRAEPETLSDASVSPTAVVLQVTTGSAPQNALSLLTTSVSNTTASGGAGVAGTLLSNKPVSPTPSPSPSPTSSEEEESEQHLANNKQQTGTETAGSEQQEQPQTTITVGSVGNYCGSCESVHHSSGTSSSATGITGATERSGQAQIDYTSASTPSPRIKLKFRKPHKSCWSRIVLAPIGSTTAGSSSATVIGSNSNETLASTGSTGNTNTNNSSSASVAAHHRLASSSASALASHPSNSQLLPTKMQAEQGSICDLQKYHSRYLKNRRHTLANVRKQEEDAESGE